VNRAAKCFCNIFSDILGNRTEDVYTSRITFRPLLYVSNKNVAKILHVEHVLNVSRCYWKNKNKTTNMGQSPTWGRPAPQVQLQRQFWVVQIPRAATPPRKSKWKVVWNRAEISLGWVNMSAYNFFVCGLKFTIFLSPNVGGVVVDQLLFQFSICGSIPEIFAIKLERCHKSHWILDVFLPSQILGCGPSRKIVPTWTPLPRGTSRGKALVTLLPLVAEL